VISALIDAGPIIALFDKDDQYHESVIGFMQSFQGRLISTWPVLTEVSYMLDFNKQTQLDFISWVAEGGIQLFDLEQWHLTKLREILSTYDDLPADFADASLIVAAESLKIEAILTLDSHFNVYRLKNKNVLQNLLKA
jgi:predicted nucleic acid-binding protein